MNCFKLSIVALGMMGLVGCGNAAQMNGSDLGSRTQDLGARDTTDDKPILSGLIDVSFTEVRSASVEKGFNVMPMSPCAIGTDCIPPIPPRQAPRVRISGFGTLSLEGLKMPIYLRDVVVDYDLSIEGGRKCFNQAVTAVAENLPLNISGEGQLISDYGEVEAGGGTVSPPASAVGSSGGAVSPTPCPGPVPMPMPPLPPKSFSGAHFTTLKDCSSPDSF